MHLSNRIKCAVYNELVSFLKGARLMSAQVNRLLDEYKRLSDEEKKEMIERIEADEFYRNVVQYSLSDWDNPKDDAYNDL